MVECAYCKKSIKFYQRQMVINLPKSKIDKSIVHYDCGVPLMMNLLVGRSLEYQKKIEELDDTIKRMANAKMVKGKVG